jgi:hypothetical protein
MKNAYWNRPDERAAGLRDKGRPDEERQAWKSGRPEVCREAGLRKRGTHEKERQAWKREACPMREAVLTKRGRPGKERNAWWERQSWGREIDLRGREIDLRGREIRPEEKRQS